MWQLGPAKRPLSGFVYVHLEQLFYGEVCSVSGDFLDAVKEIMDDDATQLKSGVRDTFEHLYAQSFSDDSILALLGTRKQRLPEFAEISIINALEGMVLPAR